MKIKSIAPKDLFRLQQDSGGIGFIDVREPDEFAAISSPLAKNFPLSSFDPEEIIRGKDRNAPLYVICRSGKRSLRAAEILATCGCEAIYNVEGGMIAWEAAGLPVVHH